MNEEVKEKVTIGLGIIAIILGVVGFFTMSSCESYIAAGILWFISGLLAALDFFMILVKFRIDSKLLSSEFGKFLVIISIAIMMLGFSYFLGMSLVMLFMLLAEFDSINSIKWVLVIFLSFVPILLIAISNKSLKEEIAGYKKRDLVKASYFFAAVFIGIAYKTVDIDGFEINMVKELIESVMLGSFIGIVLSRGVLNVLSIEKS